MKITTTLEELLAFAKNGNAEEVADFRSQLIEALGAFLHHPEVGAQLDKIARERAEEQIRRVMNEAVQVTTKGFGTDQKRTIEGWAYVLISEHLKKEIHTNMSLEELLHRQIKKESEAWRGSIEQLEARLNALVAEECKSVIPKYVTEAYAVRVAERFDEAGVQQMVSEIVRNVLTGMLTNGGAQA